MDRLTRTLAGFGLALVASAGGCRTAHDEVPPGRMYRPDAAGQGGEQVGFSTSPASKAPGTFGPGSAMTPPNIGSGGTYGAQGPGGLPAGAQAAASPYGAPAAGSPYGGAPSNDMTGTLPASRFGAPGTSGMPATDPGVMPAGGAGQGGTVNSLPGLGQAPPLGASPSARPDSGALNGFPNSPAPSGVMGAPGQAPSPL